MEFKVADALAISGSATSVPSLAVPVEPLVAFFAIALGSNFPAYGIGEASPLGASGDGIDTTTGELAAFLSISSRIFRVPLEASSSFCFRSLSAACFCFHATSLDRRSAFFSSSVGPAGVAFDDYGTVSITHIQATQVETHVCLAYLLSVNAIRFRRRSVSAVIPSAIPPGVSRSITTLSKAISRGISPVSRISIPTSTSIIFHYITISRPPPISGSIPST